MVLARDVLGTSFHSRPGSYLTARLAPRPNRGMTEHLDGASDDALYRAQVAGLYERSPFYVDKLRAAGFGSASDVGGLDRIGALPFTTKDELRRSQEQAPPLGAHAGVPIAEAARIYSTSGTSGTPCYIPLTRDDLREW